MNDTSGSTTGNGGRRPGNLREDALEQARRILEETGDESQVTLRAIARRCGVAAPSLYEYFEGISAIRAQVIADAYELFLGAVRPAFADTSDAAFARVLSFLRAYVAFAREHPALYRLLFARIAPTAMAEIGEHAAELFAELTQLLQAALAHTPPGESAQTSAIHIWLEVHGIATLPPANPHFPWPPDDELLTSLLNRFLEPKLERTQAAEALVPDPRTARHTFSCGRLERAAGGNSQ